MISLNPEIDQFSPTPRLAAWKWPESNRLGNACKARPLPQLLTPDDRFHRAVLPILADGSFLMRRTGTPVRSPLFVEAEGFEPSTLGLEDPGYPFAPMCPRVRTAGDHAAITIPHRVKDHGMPR